MEAYLSAHYTRYSEIQKHAWIPCSVLRGRVGAWLRVDRKRNAKIQLGYATNVDDRPEIQGK